MSAREHSNTGRDVVVSVQDGNYNLVEVARIAPPEDAGPAQAVTVTFDRGSTPQRPTSVRVEYYQPGGRA